MRSEQDRERGLVSRAEIAMMAGIRRSALTNWEQRYPDFPEPLRSGGSEHFRLLEVLAWAEARPVPSRTRRTGEPEGITYADRMRAYLAARSGNADNRDTVGFPEVSRVDTGEGGGEGGASPQQPTSALVEGPEADRWRSAPRTSYLALLLSLMFLRWVVPQRWRELKQVTASGASRFSPVKVLDGIGRCVDDVLRTQGVASAMRTKLEGLRPESPEDVSRLVEMAGGLGREAFRELLDHYAEAAGLDSRDSFTPENVTRLLAVLFAEEGLPRRIYDPYARGGELLSAVLAEAGDDLAAAAPTVTIGSPNGETRFLAVMNLMVHGVRPVLEEAAGASAPWHTALPDRPGADLVLTNPPFNASTAPLKEIDWPYGPPPPANDNFAWVQHVLMSLGEGGRAAIVMPNSAAFSANAKEQAIRQSMVANGVVECVVALPAKLFTTTAISVNLWILRPGTREPSRVLFIDARNLGTRVSRKLRVLQAEDHALIADAYRSWRRSRGEGSSLPQSPQMPCASVTQEDIAEAGHSLNPADYVRPVSGQRTAPDQAVASHAGLSELCRDAARADHRAGGLRFGITASGGQPGKLPDGWAPRQLHELCEVQAGPSPARLRKEMISESGEVPVVQPKHLRARRILDAEDTTVTWETARRLRAFELQAGDILCARTGTVGPSARVRPEQARWLFGSNLLRLHEFAPDVDPGYLLAYLSLPDTVAWIKGRAEKTAVPSISQNELRALPVVLPPLEEQRSIAAALDALDEQVVAHLVAARAATRVHTMLAEQLVAGALFVEGSVR